MLLALIIVSGLMSELSLRDLTVVRRLPLRAQVGRPHLVEIEVFNHKGRVPVVRDRGRGSSRGAAAPTSAASSSRSVRRALRSPPTGERRRSAAAIDHVGFRIATRFPFGLFEKSREVPAEESSSSIRPSTPCSFPPLPLGTHAGGEASLGRGYGDDYLG